ncbi:sulfatase [Verrucomicrobiales bacterium]|nr:sulfatase [Verrucomicrobiales bacterium]MDA7926860.1 sulfatase [Verrucomicrobiales bacterium]
MSLRLLLLLGIGLSSVSFSQEKPKAAKPPNIILIFTDDQGYEDLGCFGSKTIKTPNLDRMASEGLKLTNFYAQPVCGVSRAALMTGSYPIRVAEPNNIKQLHTVPHPQEVTMAEVLKSAGYSTGIIGKWHLTNKGNGPGGFDPDTMPNAQGFDYFFGTPVFNGFTVYVEDTKLRVPLYRNDEVVVAGVESWDHITADYTKEAIDYIEKNKEGPFFLYLAHNMPHIPVGASENFKGKSGYGPYGDTIEEIDWSTGQILDKLKELGLDENTLIVYTSDNGPWVETTRGMKPDGGDFIPRDHSGSAAPFRGWKMSTWEGGSRVPFIARWPKHLGENRVSDEILSTMDLLPTFAHLAGAELPKDRTLDGHEASAFLLGESQISPREDYLYYAGSMLSGIRVDQWKLVLPRPDSPGPLGWWGRMIEEISEVLLFDLAADPGETNNIAEQHPEVVTRLSERIEVARAELGDLDVVGAGARYFDDGPRKLGRGGASSLPFPGQPVIPELVGNLGFSFESGELGDWEIVEGEFEEAVTAVPSLAKWKKAPFARDGDFHLSTLMFSDGKGGSDKQTGVIQSPIFTLDGDQVAFRVSGGFDQETLYVGLIDAESGELLIRAGGESDHVMRRVVWDTLKWKGLKVRFQIVDQSVGGWGHLNVDDFSADGTLVEREVKAKVTEPALVEGRKPNFVIIFTDDQGYGDLGCFGGKHVSTPRIDQMAEEGMALTSFYVAAPVCTPSRAALMTGSYPKRVDLATGSSFPVLLSGDPKGLNPDEITIAEVLKSVGYKTGIFGKWHLGDQPDFLPTKQGFDEYLGIPYSHDIHPYHPNQKNFQFPPLALVDGEKVIEMDPDADYLTRRFTEGAVDFIERHKDEPFFLYVPHPIPHKPLHVSPGFMKGADAKTLEKLKDEAEGTIDYKTRDKLFHEAIAEIDWSLGEIIDALKAKGLDENTLVIFTSDNGPAIGSAGGLRGRKGSTYEGGMREPTVIRWPGRIPAGQSNGRLMTAMDLLPTFAALAGAKIPADRVIDGRDIWPVLTQDAPTPHEAFFYHRGDVLMAVRSGKWKLHRNKGKPSELYDLVEDAGEATNLIEANPGVVKRLSQFMMDFEADIATNSRPSAFVENPKPLSK